jgi:hypothetical protein
MNKQIKYLLCIAAYCCLLIKPDVLGAQTLDEELKTCSEITVSLIRLQCYDRLAKGPEVSVAETSNQPKRRSIFQRRAKTEKVVKEEQPSTDQVIRTDVSDETKSENIIEAKENFGKVIENEANEISSKIIGQFTGWDGDTEFKLENGQIWKQSGIGFLKVSMNNPKVKIKEGTFGGYILSVEGYNSRVKVRRVK